MTELVDSPRLVPRVALPRDRALPLVIAGSLLLHGLVLLPLLRRDRVDPRPVEIPVELVQLPDKPPEKPDTKPAEKPPAPPKAAEKSAAKPTPKVVEKPVAKPPPKVVEKSPPKPAERPTRRAARTPPPRPVQQFVPPPAQPPRPGMSVAERLKAMLGPMPALALPGESADGTESVSYAQLVLSKLAKAKKQGRYRGVPGNAGVAFSLGDNGELVRVELVAPSGDPALDDEAIAMIKRAAPYPPPPPGGRRDYAITLRFAAL